MKPLTLGSLKPGEPLPVGSYILTTPPFAVRCEDGVNWPENFPAVLHLSTGALYVADGLVLEVGADGRYRLPALRLSWPAVPEEERDGKPFIRCHKIGRFSITPDSMPPHMVGALSVFFPSLLAYALAGKGVVR